MVVGRRDNLSIMVRKRRGGSGGRLAQVASGDDARRVLTPLVDGAVTSTVAADLPA